MHPVHLGYGARLLDVRELSDAGREGSATQAVAADAGPAHRTKRHGTGTVSAGAGCNKRARGLTVYYLG